jgi:hypothetical protein
MKRRGEMRVERKQMKGRRGEVEMSSQGNEGDRMAIEEDQNGVFWCHGSAGTPLGTQAIGQDSGLEESCTTIHT